MHDSTVHDECFGFARSVLNKKIGVISYWLVDYEVESFFFKYPNFKKHGSHTECL